MLDPSTSLHSDLQSLALWNNDFIDGLEHLEHLGH